MKFIREELSPSKMSLEALCFNDVSQKYTPQATATIQEPTSEQKNSEPHSWEEANAFGILQKKASDPAKKSPSLKSCSASATSLCSSRASTSSKDRSLQCHNFYQMLETKEFEIESRRTKFLLSIVDGRLLFVESGKG
jgi:hypothetical protein